MDPELEERVREALRDKLRLLAELQRYRQESSTQLLGTRNELARLHARLEAAHRDVLQWESCWSHIQSTATQKTLLLGQIKLAVQNLFQQTTAQLRIPTDRAQEDTKAQLDMVLLCMQALAGICATGTHPQHHRSARLLRGQE
ncbi:cilia- and flagella-associated protein 73 [Geospiza fortis]|uniref:Cilia- and flagella-associated protein 73 n=1 Tax=Geospiza fortis TaxID=48883 RepID=A0A8N5HYG8_GEOFO|nr:cilia- and flagella-associated protein 73 [Geospiza fortis]